ncbi:hypothetical protein Tco_0702006 [Tanacetum coccineum]|uniref:Tf2-1-like SH3-like domain-containing protein n=1 Tax=Tanacetum coccineum TaxID=301880 RepID=A0ABQ4XUR2_9ASTR
MRPRRLLRLLSEFDCKIRYHPGKASVAAYAPSKNKWNDAMPPKGCGALSCGFSLMARYGRRHHHLCQQVLGVFKDEERLPEAIRFTGTIRNTPWEIGKNVAMDFITRLPEKTSSTTLFGILVKVGTVAYRLEPPEQLSRFHSTFHVSNLKKYLSGETLAIQLDEIQIDDTLYSIEEPV